MPKGFPFKWQRQRWRHKKTGKIVIIGAFPLREEDLTPMVYYTEDCDDPGPSWVRPVSEFFDGRFEPVVEQQPGLELDETFT